MIAMSAIITAIAVPTYISTSKFLRIAGDLRTLNGITAQAKMRAAANFTHARVFADLSGNTYQLQVWYKAGNSGSGCWVPDVDPNNTCVSYSGSAASGLGVTSLSQGVSYGFGTLTAGPTAGQTTIGQAAKCYKEDSSKPGVPDGNGTQIANTACIEFNSRGIPVDNSSAPLATGAYYINNGNLVNGVTASATGSIQAWTTPYGTANWSAQ